MSANLSGALLSLVSAGAVWKPVKTIVGGDNNAATSSVHTLSGIRYAEDSPLQSLDITFPGSLVSRHINDGVDASTSDHDDEPTGGERVLLAESTGVSKPLKRRPVFIFIHGGGWCRGDKANRFYGAPSMCENMAAAAGCISVASGYRLGNYPDFMHDTATAIGWVRDNITNLGGDLDNVFLSGHSAGGHIASLLVLRHSRFLPDIPLDFFRGLVLISGVYDLFCPMQKAPLDAKNKTFVVAYVIPAFGYDETLRREASPLLLLDPTKETSLLGRASMMLRDNCPCRDRAEDDGNDDADTSSKEKEKVVLSKSSQKVTTSMGDEVNTSSLPPTLILNASFDMGLQENGKLMAGAMSQHTEEEYKHIPWSDHASICWNNNTVAVVSGFINSHCVVDNEYVA